MDIFFRTFLGGTWNNIVLWGYGPNPHIYGKKQTDGKETKVFLSTDVKIWVKLILTISSQLVPPGLHSLAQILSGRTEYPSCKSDSLGDMLLNHNVFSLQSILWLTLTHFYLQNAVDPWITGIWPVPIHLSEDFISINITLLKDSWMVESADAELWLQRADCRTWASDTFGILGESWNQSPALFKGQLFSLKEQWTWK